MLGIRGFCYDGFSLPKWDKKKREEESKCGKYSKDELLNLTDYLVFVKKEICILAQ